VNGGSCSDCASPAEKLKEIRSISFSNRARMVSMSSMTERSYTILIFCFFAALVFFAKLPILTTPLYWDEMG
jgi:hypothetical protein